MLPVDGTWILYTAELMSTGTNFQNDFQIMFLGDGCVYRHKVPRFRALTSHMSCDESGLVLTASGHRSTLSSSPPDWNGQEATSINFDRSIRMENLQM